MTMTRGRLEARQGACFGRATRTAQTQRARNRTQLAGRGTRLLAAIALLVTGVHGATAQDVAEQPDYALQMSTSLTWETTGDAPIPIATAPADTAVAEAPGSEVVAPGRSGGITLAVLCAALGFVAGAWLTWRRPRDLTPAQERLGNELRHARERYLGLLNRRSAPRNPEWDSTVDTLRSDLALARALSDRLLDNKQELQAVLEEKQRELASQSEAREVQEETMALVREELAQSRAMHEAEQERVAKLTMDVESARSEAKSQHDFALELAARAQDADTQRDRANELEASFGSASEELARLQGELGELEQAVSAAHASNAAMVDKNLGLETELERLRDTRNETLEQRAGLEAELTEKLALATQALAAREADTSATLKALKAEHAEQVATLEITLESERATMAQREQNLREVVQAAKRHAATAEEEKRRILSILQQEKAAAKEAIAQLAQWQAGRAELSQKQEAVQKMLATAEDRIDDQESQIAELYEENQQLRREVLLIEEQRAELAEQHAELEQFVEAADHHEGDNRIGSLAEARMTIGRLEADLRVRCDLVKTLRADAQAGARAQSALQERDQEIAVLRNELAMALDEVGRMRQRELVEPRVTPRDVKLLRERIDGLEERILGKEKEIAILRAAANDDIDGSPLRDHLASLERDQEASIAVVRYLEGEVRKLSLPPQGSTSQTA